MWSSARPRVSRSRFDRLDWICKKKFTKITILIVDSRPFGSTRSVVHFKVGSVFSSKKG